MIGQEALQNLINKYSAETFPQSIIIEGDEGSGRRLILNLIIDKLNKEAEDITDRISLDTIFEISLTAIPKVYIINCSVLSIKDQNVILKLLEEPPSGATIILIVELISQLLPTVRNRCQIFKLAPYSKEELRHFLGNSQNLEILNFADTPGQIKNLINCDLPAIINLCDLIIDKIAIAAISNTLSIINKINFDGKDKNKIDPILFGKILLSRLVTKISLESDPKYRYLYQLTDSYLYKLMYNKSIDKVRLTELFLLDFKECCKYGH